jgi:hypothetical protein
MKTKIYFLFSKIFWISILFLFSCLITEVEVNTPIWPTKPKSEIVGSIGDEDKPLVLDNGISNQRLKQSQNPWVRPYPYLFPYQYQDLYKQTPTGFMNRVGNREALWQNTALRYMGTTVPKPMPGQRR